MDQSKITWSAFAISAVAFTASMAGVAGARDVVKSENSIGGSLDNILEAASRCPVDARGGGIGGNSAQCQFPCKDIDYVFVRVHSADPDAGVSGRGECGSAGAVCTGHQTCIGKSRGLAGETSTSGSCKGSSDEAWRSAMTLDCWGEPSGTCSIVCQEYDGYAEQDPQDW